MVFSASQRAGNSSRTFLPLEVGLDRGGADPSTEKPPGFQGRTPPYVLTSALDALWGSRVGSQGVRWSGTWGGDLLGGG